MSESYYHQIRYCRHGEPENLCLHCMANRLADERERAMRYWGCLKCIVALCHAHPEDHAGYVGSILAMAVGALKDADKRVLYDVPDKEG